MADRTAIIKPRIADKILTPSPKSWGRVEKKANVDAAIPEIGCVIWWNMGI
jgi:hypothetical protein